MKMKLLMAVSILALASTAVQATNLESILNPLDHATRTEVKVADQKLQSQITQHGYEINTQAKYTTSVNEDLQASKAAGVAAYNQVQGQLTANSERVDGVQTQVNDVQNAAQIANEKADAGAVRADGIEKSLANTDNRSINNAVRLDGVEANVGKNTTDIGNLKGDVVNAQNTANTAVGIGQDAKNTAINAQNTADYAVGQGQKNANDIVNTTKVAQDGYNKAVVAGQVNDRQDVQLGQHAEALNEYGQRIANQEDITAALNQSFSGYASSTNQRLDSMQSQIDDVDRKAEKAQNMAVGALAVASLQFDTNQEAGFQVAGGVATMGGKQAMAFGAGGAVTKKVFVSASVTQASGVNGAAVSATYSFGR